MIRMSYPDHGSVDERIVRAGAIFFCMLLTGLVAHVRFVRADEASDRRRLIEQQIQELEREAQTFDQSVQQAQGEVRTLANEKKILENEARRREVEVRRLTLVIRKVVLEIQQKSATISVLSKKIETSREALGASLFFLYTADQDNALTILMKHRNLSDFFTSVNNLNKVQSTIKTTLETFKDDRSLLEAEKEDLQNSQEEQEGLRALQEVERRALTQKKAQKEELLRLTKGKEEIFQKLLTSKKKDIASLRTQLFYLEKTGITAEDALRLADNAARRAGIRTAFLLALLEVETGKQFEDGTITVGTNLGTGNWKRDLYDCYVNLGKRGAAEAEKAAFFKITNSLGFNPDAMRVSRKPDYGCGGAMGQAQFLPTTWLRFASRVATLTGHNPPSPWSAEDAFTAAAIFLADAGADSKNAAGEIAAAKTYISGNPSCSRSICRYYSNRILALSHEIDRIL